MTTKENPYNCPFKREHILTPATIAGSIEYALKPAQRKTLEPYRLAEASAVLYEVLCLWADGHRPYLECVKAPRGSLDTGGHYYEVGAYTKDGPVIVWPYGPEIGKLWGFKGKDIGRRYWNLYSRVLGMSRAYDAVETLGHFIGKHCLTPDVRESASGFKITNFITSGC